MRRHSPHPPQISEEVPLYIHCNVGTKEISPWQPNPPVDKASGKSLDDSQYLKHQQPQPHLQEHSKQKFQCHRGEQPSLVVASSTAKRVPLTSPHASFVQHREYNIPSPDRQWWNCHTDPLDAPWSPESTRDQAGVYNPHRHGTNTNKVTVVAAGGRGKESGPVDLLPRNNADMDDTNSDDIRRALVCIPEKNERSASCNSISVSRRSQDVHSPSRTVPRSRLHSIIGFINENQTMNGQVDTPVNKDRAVEPNLNTTNNLVRWRRSPDTGSSSIASAWCGASPSPRSTNRYDFQEEKIGSISPVISGSSKKCVTQLSPRQSHNIHDVGTVAIEERPTGHAVSREFHHQARANSTTPSKTATRVSDGGVTKRRSISTPKSQFQCTILKECDAVFTCNSLLK